MARAPSGWHPEDIKAELRKRFGPLSRISCSWGMNRNAIAATLRRPEYSRVVERRVAEALCVPLHVLWPARWSSDGTALPRSPDFDPIDRSRVRNSQNQKAA